MLSSSFVWSPIQYYRSYVFNLATWKTLSYCCLPLTPGHCHNLNFQNAQTIIFASLPLSWNPIQSTRKSQFWNKNASRKIKKDRQPYDGKLFCLKDWLQSQDSLVVVSYPFRHETATRKSVNLRGTEVNWYHFQESAKTTENKIGKLEIQRATMARN